MRIEKAMNGYYMRKLPLVKDMIAQYLSPPEDALLGSVHRENVGDMALCASVGSELTGAGVSWGMQPAGNKGMLGLSRFPEGQGRAIIAGGT